MALEDSLVSWAKPPGETEQTKCDNAVKAVRKAIDASTKLANKSVRVFAQGSYCNRTNVRQDSDVDVCILSEDTIIFDLPTGKSATDFGLIVPAPYQYPEYKNDIGSALVTHFGVGGVSRGNKAFDVHENTYRIDADAVAAFEHRRYYENGYFLKQTTQPRPDAGSGQPERRRGKPQASPCCRKRTVSSVRTQSTLRDMRCSS